jgi:hypothetical protein
MCEADRIVAVRLAARCLQALEHLRTPVLKGVKGMNKYNQVWPGVNDCGHAACCLQALEQLWTPILKGVKGVKKYEQV